MWVLSRTPYSMMITHGVKEYADKNGCYWLVDAILSHIPTVREESITFWTLSRNKLGGVVLLGTDGGRGDDPIRTLVRQEIAVTDFPERELPAKIWVQRTESEEGKNYYTLMLPEEY